MSTIKLDSADRRASTEVPTRVSMFDAIAWKGCVKRAGRVLNNIHLPTPHLKPHAESPPQGPGAVKGAAGAASRFHP
jgi:hypothetical protein